MSDIKIFYCNFPEVKSKKDIKKCFPPKEFTILESSWLKIYYTIFMGNIINEINLTAIQKDAKSYIEIFTKEGFTEDEADKIINDKRIVFNSSLNTIAARFHDKDIIKDLEKEESKIYCNKGNFWVQQTESESYLTREQSAMVFSCIVKSLVENKMIDMINNVEIVFICHDKHIGLPYQPDYLFSETNRNEFELIFEGLLKDYIDEIDNIKIKEIISFQHEPTSKTFQHIEENGTINYNSLIGSLKGQQKIDNLKDLKKKLINLWLPLAINIQGLSEVEKGKREEYYKDVRDELLNNNKEYYTSMLNNWSDIKENLKNFNIDLKIPTDLLNEIIDTAPKDAFKNATNKTEDRKDFYNVFILNKEYFLPNWLNAVLIDIDELIEPPPQKGKK